jgi:tRNA pseudouridine38-40 synthase
VFGSNTRLSRDVAVLWAKPVDADFHARFSALQRHYRYLIFNRPVRSALWDAQVSWFCRPLDVAKMQEAAVYLHGEHDFSAFRASSCQAKNPVRTVSQLTLRAQGDWLALDIVANGFLHHMVRNIAGSLLAVGQGQYPPDWIKAVLASRSRSLAGVTALPNGLYFCQVIYPAHYALPQIAPAWPLSH